MLRGRLKKGAELLLTWSLGSLFGGRVLALGLDGGRVEDPRGGAVLAEVLLQAFDGAIQLAGPDLEVDVHEICRRRRRMKPTQKINSRFVCLLADRMMTTRM